jgi:hypothetical protein
MHVCGLEPSMRSLHPVRSHESPGGQDTLALARAPGVFVIELSVELFVGAQSHGVAFKAQEVA